MSKTSYREGLSNNRIEPVYLGGLMRIASIDNSREICHDGPCLVNNHTNIPIYRGGLMRLVSLDSSREILHHVFASR